MRNSEESKASTFINVIVLHDAKGGGGREEEELVLQFFHR